MKILLLLLFRTFLVLADNTPFEEFSSGNKLFTQDIYNQILVDNNENILVSPFSAEAVLALTQSGARGATGEEIRTTLHLASTEEETETEFKTVLPLIRSDYVTLATANKIYVENDYSIREDFKKVAREVFQADVQNVEFSQSEEAAEEINKWVAEETDDKIRNLVVADDFDENTKIVLVNALYFQGNWTIPFNPYFTSKTKFFTSEDSTVDTLTMYQESALYDYYESDDLDAQILEVPFQGGEATMTFVLPNKKEGIAILEKQMSKALTRPKYNTEFVQVVLPKFRIESTLDIKDILEKMGVHKAFDFMQADFSGISGQPGELVITKARQKTFIDVNEVGVEAAAATAMSGSNDLVPKPGKFFIADHPFIFYIKFADIVLFEGRVLVPEYS